MQEGAPADILPPTDVGSLPAAQEGGAAANPLTDTPPEEVTSTAATSEAELSETTSATKSGDGDSTDSGHIDHTGPYKDYENNPTDEERAERLAKEKDYEKDYPKSWDSAIAGNETRSIAAGARQEISDLPTDEELEKKGDEYTVRGAKRDRNYKQRDLQYEEAWNDHVANKSEEWAGVLHDHPVSEEFKRRHPDIDFSAKGLATLEISNIQTEARFNAVEELIDDLSIERVLQGGLYYDEGIFGPDTLRIEHVIPGTNINTIGDQITVHAMFLEGDYLGAWPEGEKKSEWETLIHNPDTTLDQLKTFYQATFKQAYLSQAQKRAGITKAFLEEVKSGQAN